MLNGCSNCSNAIRESVKIATLVHIRWFRTMHTDVRCASRKMDKPISELTYKIVAFPEIQQADTNESIDWAVEMMEHGYNSPTL